MSNADISVNSKAALKQKKGSWLDFQIQLALENLAKRPKKIRSPFYIIEHDTNESHQVNS